MIWNRRFFYVVIICCLFIISSLSTLWAAESDTARLINLLKSKNIIDQKEADQLLQEVKESAQKEQKEKEEIKAAAKGAVLPDVLKGLKFSTTIFAEWNSKNLNDAAATNEFNVNRTYLTLSKDINDWLGMSATTDIFTSKDSADKGNGLEVRLKYAFATLKLFGTETKLGMIGTPPDAYDSSIWPFRVQGKNMWDDLGIQPSTDVGISNQGVFGGYMDDEYLKFASKPFAGKWGGYSIGIFNGSGYTVGENNGNKVVSGMLYVRPLPSVPVLKGLQIAYAGTYGKSNETFSAPAPTGKLTTDYPDCTSNAVQLSLQHKLFTVMGQYYWGESTATAKDENDRKSCLLEAFLRIPGIEKTRIFGRYLYFDQNTDVDQDEWNRVTAGIAYDMFKEFMPFVAYEKKTFDTNTATNKDYDQFQVGFQLKF